LALVLVTVVCMLLLMVGCGKTGGGKTTVKLLDPGVEPRTTLRYRFLANRTETMVIDMSTL